jgi:DNA polymerase III delta prime subunit
MIHVFCNKRGSGKTKALINMANEKILQTKGDVVYIDDDNRHLFDLDRRIRFISTKEYNLKDYNCFYGFLCGIISEDYDVDTIYIDGLFNIVQGNISDAAHLFFDLEKISKEYNIEFYINVNHEENEVPEFIKKYVA